MKRKIRMGMVGGGPGSLIGAMHRMAARLDGKIDLTSGVFSTDRSRSLAVATELFLPESRCFRNYDEMLEFENELFPDERIDCVAVVAPDALHYDIAAKALDHGFHVICEKPMALSSDQARALVAKVRETGLIFALACNHNGYPMVNRAHAMIQAGEIGEINHVTVKYPQGRLDGSVENLIGYVTGLKITDVRAELSTPESRLFAAGDNILLRFDNGARGSITGVKEENDLSFRIRGAAGSLEWRQANPSALRLKHTGKPPQILSAAAPVRTPAGCPEGFLESFANIYTRFADAVWAHLDGDKKFVPDFPNADDGLRGVIFVETVVRNSLKRGN